MLNRKGFALIELLVIVAVAVIALISLLAIWNIQKAREIAIRPGETVLAVISGPKEEVVQECPVLRVRGKLYAITLSTPPACIPLSDVVPAYEWTWGEARFATPGISPANLMIKPIDRSKRYSLIQGGVVGSIELNYYIVVQTPRDGRDIERQYKLNLSTEPPLLVRLEF